MCLIEDIISQIATFGVFQCNFHALCLQLLGYFFATNAHPRYIVGLTCVAIDIVESKFKKDNGDGRFHDLCGFVTDI